MSDENVDVVRRIYESYARGELSPLELFDPEIEWRGPREFPDLAEAHYGHEGVKR
jgi:ketosteroid isomerase-like protein